MLGATVVRARARRIEIQSGRWGGGDRVKLNKTSVILKICVVTYYLLFYVDN